jgi:hypothetical protein
LNLLQHRIALHGDGLDPGGEIVRVIEEYPGTAEELTEAAARGGGGFL